MALDIGKFEQLYWLFNEFNVAIDRIKCMIECDGYIPIYAICDRI